MNNNISHFILASLIGLLVIGCTAPSPEPEPTELPAPSRPTPALFPTPTRVNAPERLVAIGDLHGDYEATIEILKMAGVVSPQLDWTGGKTIVVQVGDQLDRGQGEKEILDLFEHLASQAHDAGGGLYPLLGNHEIMNVEQDYRYVTDGGWAAFASVPFDPTDSRLALYTDEQKPRVAAFLPGGPYARVLARHNLVMMVGDTLFVHGGIFPIHISYGLENINRETQAWLRGDADYPPSLDGDYNPVWARHYSNETTLEDCTVLEQTLSAAQATRIVVAHTVQRNGINSACDGQVWRVDVGLATYYGGTAQFLEIKGSEITVIKTRP